ncbi:MAG: hypothetical protein F6J98_24460 [Moorea sp. SIO4G2]|nr:hypothetical protein [Moorena sp. SIO4A3]NEO63414.1 hypothetical protein [Moorena sp. SIO4G2]
MIKASLSYSNYRLWRRLAVGHAKGEREQTTRALPWFPPLALRIKTMERLDYYLWNCRYLANWLL